MPAGRPKGSKNHSGYNRRTQKAWTDKIPVSRILEKLIRQALGQEEVPVAVQVRAAEILLRKVLPDQAAVQANVKHEFEVDWASRLVSAYQGDRDSETAKPDGLH